ncbi:peptidoglycan D,D-transpeptidase FtsI family protein [Subdoligranulum variabile]|nr:penicillin-binding protein 2 [Subdoligranulum variabile]UWP68214.1 penicillin-binding protein 2 [Subdoligranulum variabile]
MSMSRLRMLSVSLVLLTCIVLCRVLWVSTDTLYAASAGTQTEQITELPRTRGNFFDRSGQLLTGYTPEWYALCIPGDISYATLFPYVSYAEQAELYEKRNTTSPFLIQVDQDLTMNGIPTYESAQRYLPLPIAVHLLGYLDGEGKGVSGLEYAYDDILSRSGDISVVSCLTTAQGNLLTGDEPIQQLHEKGTGQGVSLTLDADIQRVCEGIAGLTMKRGCILVMETATGDLLASVSMPEYDPNNVAKSIRANDTSLINRTFNAFSAGSVFKVVLAAAAYENNLDWFTHECTGSVEVAGQTYRCAQGRAHGIVNLRGALEQSCNCYFVELGRLLGEDSIRSEAEKLGFGSACAIAPGLKSSAGMLPESQDLQNAGQLALFSFGQGDLSATPLQITAMMNTVANGGVYYTPRFVYGVVDDDLNLTDSMQLPESEKVLDSDTARILRDMLQSVISEGIGREAAPREEAAGGKTGTAQTGQFDEEGEELLNYWFSGFYPADHPRYTITVLQDGVLEPDVSSAAIFAQIADSLHVLMSSESIQTPETAAKTS